MLVMKILKTMLKNETNIIKKGLTNILLEDSSILGLTH